MKRTNYLAADRLKLLVCFGLVVVMTVFAFLSRETTIVNAGVPAQIYDNGPFQTGATTNSGVAAPAGSQWSEVQNPAGNLMEANATAGLSCSVTTTVFRCGDDFNVPAGQSWTINQVVVMAYQTGFAGTLSPITGATLRIWSGAPGAPGSTVIFGDTTTNRLASSIDTSTFRVFNTVVGNGGNPPTAPGTTRRIWRNSINVAPGLVLAPGNYWIDWNTTVSPNAAHFAPLATVVGTRGLPGWNAIQSTDGGVTYAPFEDAGIAPTGAPPPPSVPQDFPFKLIGSIAGGATPTPTPVPPTPTPVPPTPTPTPVPPTPTPTPVVTPTPVATPTPFGLRSRADFDGDGKTDLSVFRPSEGNWYLGQSTAGFAVIRWGLSGDVLTPGDYDGDGKADTAVFRANADSSMPDFYILNSNGFVVTGVSWGVAGDIPVNRDYDGDGRTDVGLYRPSNSIWYILTSGGPAVYTQFGQSGDVPVAGDFDGDGRGDLTVYRAGVWISQLSAGGSSGTTLAGSRLVPADYDNDNKDDVAVWNSTTGVWTIIKSTGGTQTTNWGQIGDIPVPGDYDGDGADDLAIYRGGQWWLLRSTAGAITYTFGLPTDIPIPTAYIP